MPSFKSALKIYALPQPGEVRPKRKKTTVVRVTDSTSAASAESANHRNSDLDIFFDNQRREHEAATRIKRCWKRCRVLVPWRQAVYTLLRIVRVQARARGMLARRFVAIWFRMKTRFVIDTQARVRRLLSNKHIKPVLAREVKAVRLLQRMIRGMFARRRCLALLRNLCATRIQALWRGVVDRSKADKKWLNVVVIPMQKGVRAMIARRKFVEIRRKLHEAATVIQRRFRLSLAVHSISERLYQRDMRYRQHTIAQLTAEESLCQEKIERLMERVVKMNIKEKAEQAAAAVATSEEQIYEKERALMEISRQLEILTPRAIRQGFNEELSKRLAETRKELTALKRKHITELCKDQLAHAGVFELQVREMEDWASRCHRASRWRVEEHEDKRHINYEREINMRRRQQRQAAANERRRWEVHFYTPDGKPDKKRRPGRPWDPSVFAGAEKATYSSANVDLLAFYKDDFSARESRKTGSAAQASDSTPGGVVEQVDRTMQQVALQAYLEQMRVYEELMDPIARILQRHMGFLPQKDGKIRGLAQAGWGPQGEQVEQALRAIGADQIEANNREKLIGGFSKHNIIYQHEHQNVLLRGQRPKTRDGLSREKNEDAADAEEDDRRSSAHGNSALWNDPFDTQPQPSQPLSAGYNPISSSASSISGSQLNEGSVRKANGKPKNKERTQRSTESFFSAADGVESVMSYSTASLEPGSAFPQNFQSLRYTTSAQSLRHNSSSGQLSPAKGSPKNASFSSSQRNRLSRSREQDRLLNPVENQVVASGNPRQLENGDLVNGSDAGVRPGSDTGKQPSAYTSSIGISAMFDLPIDDQLSAITEAAEDQQSVITAEEIFKSLRRCWKKPAKQYLPTPSAFASLYAEEVQQLQQSRQEPLEESLQSSNKFPSLQSDSLLSKSTPNYFKIDKDYLAHQREEEERDKRTMRSSLAQATANKPKPKPKESTQPMKKKTVSEPEPFYREDLITEQQKKRDSEMALRRAMHDSLRTRKKSNVRTSVIPWSLLDQMEGQQKRFESEVAHIEFNHKF